MRNGVCLREKSSNCHCHCCYTGWCCSCSYFRLIPAVRNNFVYAFSFFCIFFLFRWFFFGMQQPAPPKRLNRSLSLSLSVCFSVCLSAFTKKKFYSIVSSFQCCYNMFIFFSPLLLSSPSVFIIFHFFILLFC